MTGTATDSDTGFAPRLRIAVGIATVGRPDVLRATLAEVGRQSRAPDGIVVCAPTAGDFAGVEVEFPYAKCIVGPRGLSHQRNSILDVTSCYDVVVFFDDDFIPCPHYLERIEEVHSANPEVAITTGRVVADGILGPGLDLAAARSALEMDTFDRTPRSPIEDVHNGYGCNMSVRLGPVQAHCLRFDGNLPLYGWLEDVDFSRQLARYGRIVRVSAARGVHLGVKSGRQSGLRLGYSQVANPLYLMRKGTLSWKRAAYLMSRNVAANLYGSVRPEPYIDRAGRIAGNALAFVDLITGRLAPTRILSM